MGSRSLSCMFFRSICPLFYWYGKQICCHPLCRRPSTHVPHYQRVRASEIGKRRCHLWCEIREQHGCQKILVWSTSASHLLYWSIFSAQRNVYLTGFCLFLSLVLTRTFYIILELLRTQEEYATLKKNVCLTLLFYLRLSFLINLLLLSNLIIFSSRQLPTPA